jgi:hypothetical protein
LPKHWNKREAEEDVTRTKREVLPGIALCEKQELIQRRHFAIRARMKQYPASKAKIHDD